MRLLPLRRSFGAWLLILAAHAAAVVLMLFGAPARSEAAPAFADPAFAKLWEYADAPVGAGQVQRSWYWGPVPGEARKEPYSGSKTGTRLVQYFDKARMEINNPGGDHNSEWFVTTGLLVAEMVSGKQQVGDKEYAVRQAAEIAVGGDGLGTDPEAPTYTSFRPVSSLRGPGDNRAPNRVGQRATATLDRAGKTGDNAALGLYPGAALAAYSEVLGHNIPVAMWDFLNLKGVVRKNGSSVEGQLIANWIFAMGYPISEPYWTRVKIDGIYQDALFQMYERRSLAYVPAMPKGWQVQMGNVGAHYYRWIYGGPLPTPLVPLVTPTASAAPATAVPSTPKPTRPAAPTATQTAGPRSPTPTLPPVPTQPAGGLLLSVQPGYGPPNGQFTFSARGLQPGENVQVKFTDPTGAVVYPAGSNNGSYTADPSGQLSITLVPQQAFPAAPLGTWLWEVTGLRSGLEGVVGFTLR